VRTDVIEGTHESESTFVRVLVNVFRQVPTWHPNRNELGRIKCGAKEGDNVWVVQVLPRDSL